MTSVNERPTDIADGLEADLCSFIDAEVSLDPDTPVRPDTDLLLTGQVDSMGVVQIVAWIEDRLGIQVDPVDVVLENFQTVAAMVAFCRRVVQDL
jgi:acyl carrier protein